MKSRHVFSTKNVAEARSAVLALNEQGVVFDDISLVARSDIELDSIPDGLKEADSDFKPAAIRGMGIGGATGLLAGLAAVVFTPIGITLAGAAAVGAMGALVGGWSSALMGSALPDPVRQQFDDEISAGRILVLVDADEDTQARVTSALAAIGVPRLDYEAPTAMTWSSLHPCAHSRRMSCMHDARTHERTRRMQGSRNQPAAVTRQLTLALGLGIALSSGFASAGTVGSGMVRYVGEARDTGGRLLYREAHYLDNRAPSPRRVVLYQCADGRAFARKTVDGSGPAPAFAFIDARDGYQEGVRMQGGRREVFWQAAKAAPVKRSPIDKSGASVFDAGFDAYVREHFVALQQGKALRARFLIPSRLSAIGVSVKPVAGAPAGHLDLKTRLDAWYGFALPELRLRYRIADRQLVRFEGIGTIRDAKGSHGKLRIDFAQPAAAIDAGELQRAREAPLGGACGGGM